MRFGLEQYQKKDISLLIRQYCCSMKNLFSTITFTMLSLVTVEKKNTCEDLRMKSFIKHGHLALYNAEKKNKETITKISVFSFEICDPKFCPFATLVDKS